MKKDRRSGLVYGVGINDADYDVVTRYFDVERGKGAMRRCPFYTKWVAMLARGYSSLFHSKHPTYLDCMVCDEWLTFSNFKSWMELQDWEGKHLDKDVLSRGNKIYSPDTCVFVDAKVNNFLTESDASRGDYPIGVNLDKATGKYKAQCYDVTTGKKQYLGLFDSPNKAHETWLAFKLSQAKILAAAQTDRRVAEALVYTYENYKS